MRTKREPTANQTRTTRGVRELHRPGRPNPFGVQWREKVAAGVGQGIATKIKTLFFPTKESRDRKMADLVTMKRGGMMMHSISRAELDDYRAFKAACEGETWQNVVAGWKAHGTATGATTCRITVAVAVTDYLVLMEKRRDEGKLGKDTFRQKDHKLRMFSDHFGTTKLDAVTADDIEMWVDDFDEVRTDVTFDNYVKHVSSLFGYWIKTKRALRDNPCEQIHRRNDGIGKVEMITPAQTAQLFHTAMTFADPKTGAKTFMPIIGRLALEAFIGLRFGSGSRIAKEDINFVDKGVTLQKSKTKTRRRYYIDHLPAQLWDWLAISPESGWALTPRQYMGLKSSLFLVANVPHPRNCLRHSFATYDVAAHHDAGRTARILCHRDQELLWKHYLGIATSEQGKLYQSITPTTAQAIAVGFTEAVQGA